MSKIRIAIAGVGSCSSALVQGIAFYNKHPEFKHGLTYEDIGGYNSKELEFVVGFDIDSRKLNQPIWRAIYEKPNCNMRHIDPYEIHEQGIANGLVHRGPTLDGIAPHMRDFPRDITFDEDTETPAIGADEYKSLLIQNKVDVLLNYMPVGSREASKFYIENAIEAGVHVVNCMPTYISTDEAKKLEEKAIEYGVTIVGSDMRSAFGASRMSEVLQGSMLDSGLTVTQHIQTNMAAGSTQGDMRITGRSCNTDFGNMAVKSRLEDKHVSKENVLAGQNRVRDVSIAGTTMFAGPSLTVLQKPGGEYIGSDNKIANFDIVAFGWAGAKYELTARLSVQDSPNSGGIVFDAIRFCKVASELGVVGYLRGVSAWTQKTPPVQMKAADAKFECDALSRRIITPMVQKQLKDAHVGVENLDWTFQKSTTDYQ